MIKTANLYNNIEHSDITITLCDGNMPAHRFVLMCGSSMLQPIFSPTSIGFSGNTITTLDFSKFNSVAVRVIIAIIYGIDFKIVRTFIINKDLISSVILLEMYQFANYLGADWIIEILNNEPIQLHVVDMVKLLLYIFQMNYKPKWMQTVIRFKYKIYHVEKLLFIERAPLVKLINSYLPHKNFNTDMLIVIYNMNCKEPKDLILFEYNITKDKDMIYQYLEFVYNCTTYAYSHENIVQGDRYDNILRYLAGMLLVQNDMFKKNIHYMLKHIEFLKIKT